MNKHKGNVKDICIICGEELIYSATAAEAMTCELCGRSFKSNVRCKKGHFVCDKCHEKKGLEIIIDACKNLNSRSPMEILIKLLRYLEVHMRGPSIISLSALLW